MKRENNKFEHDLQLFTQDFYQCFEIHEKQICFIFILGEQQT